MSDRVAPDVYFPMEITSREYAGSLLLAVELAGRGMTAIVGHKSRVRRAMGQATRPGVLFFKGGHDGGWRNASEHVQIGIDPETGITYPEFEEFFQRRKALWDMSTTAVQFCYGSADHDFFTDRFPHLAHRFHRVGTPRVQAWGPDGEALYHGAVREIHRNFGRFVLIVGSDGALHETYRGRADTVAADDVWRVEGRRDASANNRLVQFAGRVSEELGVAVVIRPHPVESWDAWLDVVSQWPGVFVEGAFDLSAWARAAEVVVHSGKSTAAFEAAVGETPSIGLVPPEARRWVPGVLSHQAQDLDSAVELVRRALDPGLALLPSTEAEELLDSRIDRPEIRPTVRIADVLEGIVDLSAGSTWGRREIGRARGWRRHRSPRSEHLGAVPPFKRWPLNIGRIRRDVDAVSAAWGHARTPKVRSLGPNCAVIGP